MLLTKSTSKCLLKIKQCKPKLRNHNTKIQGDSGGPFTFKAPNSNQHVLIGVVATATGKGHTPANSFKPAGENKCGDSTGFVRVSAIRDWIDEILSGAIICKNGVDAD